MSKKYQWACNCAACAVMGKELSKWKALGVCALVFAVILTVWSWAR